VDSAFLIWPDNSFQPISFGRDSVMSISYTRGLPVFNYDKVKQFYQHAAREMENITDVVGIKEKHEENPFLEFNREPLLPHMLSTEGPALAVADINHDGLQDIFVGSSKTFHDAILIQQPGGRFKKTEQPGMLADSMYEDVDAIWTDVNNDGHIDLVVASGGNEYYGDDEHLLPRVYLNNGTAGFTKLENAFPALYQTFSTIRSLDFNGDGFTDLFLGGRAVPWEYGQIPHSYLLQNDGTGRFTDVTATYAKELSQEGMITGAACIDLDKDGDLDLVVCSEWGTIDAFINKKGSFSKKVLSSRKGWWNFVMAADLDNDGDLDLIAGNLGKNSRLKASIEQPVRLYYNDFDNNGKKEQILTYYVNGKELPFANKDELQRQIPLIKKKYYYAGDFAKASIEDIFSSEKLSSAEVLQADYFDNAILLNDGKMNFTLQSLPWEAQLAPYRDAAIINANNDGLPDILLVGNFYENNIQMGRYDADFGTILVNQGNGKFIPGPINGLTLKGQVRHVRPVKIGPRDAYILARNNDSVMVLGFKKTP
jgi:hypothetical protein